MKHFRYPFLQIAAAVTLAFFAGCQEKWDGHYGQQETTAGDGVEIFKGTAEEWFQSNAGYSVEYKMLAGGDIFQKMNDGGQYTLLAYPDSRMQAQGIPEGYASYCVSDMSLSPSRLKDGLGLTTWYGKNIWIKESKGSFLIDQYPYTKVIRTSNAYIYVVEEGVIPIHQSVYEAIMSLDDSKYSTFKGLVRRFEEKYFDGSRCTPAGTNEQGNIVYSDSIKGWVTRNTLMDRYTEEGQAMWDMRSETYFSTVFIPSNEIIKAALDTAKTKVPLWLGRAFTSTDQQKYEKWIVRACFVNRRLTDGDVAGTTDIDCVGGYIKGTTDSGNDRYDAADYTMWRPTVQKVRTSDRVPASNGNLYYVDYLKVPNNVIIYRLKARFYELWNNMDKDQRSEYFRWDHWTDPMVLNDAQGSFTLSETLPTIYYHVLTAIPDKEARRDSLPCSVTYDGVLYNESNPKGSRIQKCFIPAGEYYLRMGFKHSLLYSLSIQFCDTMMVEDMVMYAQGSDFHFDRGSVSVVDNYGESSIGYPEGYNWHDWSSLSEKAQAYDTDGFQIGVVRMKHDGYFTITVTSNDMCRLYDYTQERTTSNVKQLMMYHWCLRPTKNNY